jgi:hypothetical protein
MDTKAATADVLKHLKPSRRKPSDILGKKACLPILMHNLLGKPIYH